MKCKFCSNYMGELDTCKFCHFEFDEDSDYYVSDDWDILNLPEENGWEHIQILDRLHLNGIECFSADIWFDNDMAYLTGCFEHTDKIAKVLGLNRESVYNDVDCGLVLLNLYKEKMIRNREKM